MKKAETNAVSAATWMGKRVPKWAIVDAEMPAEEDAYYLRSIGRALEVLNSFDGQTPLSLEEISARLSLPESSLFRVLHTLEKHNYLKQLRDGSYQLSAQLIFGWRGRAADRVRNAARPELEHLVNTFNETASLGHLFTDSIHVVDYVESFHDVRITSKIGRVLPPHCSAMGKAIVAFQERELADRLLDAYGLIAQTEFTVTDRRKLFSEFAQVRASGYASDREESVRGGICFAAPISANNMPVMAAISLSGLKARMDAKRELEMQEALMHAAQNIANKL